MIKVTNQLVAAPTGSNVHIQCYVETSPKAMHSWAKINGETFATRPFLDHFIIRFNLCSTSVLKPYNAHIITSRNSYVSRSLTDRRDLV